MSKYNRQHTPQPTPQPRSDKSSFWSKTASLIANSPIVIPVYLSLVVMFVISIGAMYNDYWTSVSGYLALPLRRYTDWIAGLVGFAPMVGQIVFFYLFAEDTQKNWWAIWLVAAFHVADAGTDIWFKLDGEFTNPAMVVIAILETEIVYQLMSELFFTFSLAMIPRLARNFIQQTAESTIGILVSVRQFSQDAGEIINTERERARPGQQGNRPRDGIQDSFYYDPAPKVSQPFQRRPEPAYQGRPLSGGVKAAPGASAPIPFNIPPDVWSGYTQQKRDEITIRWNEEKAKQGGM